MSRIGCFVGALGALLLTVTASADWTVPPQNEVHLEGNGRSWFVRATLNGTMQGLFLLDTGASYCVLTPAAARRLGVGPSTQEATVVTANGPVKASLIQLTSVDIGGNRARDISAVVHNAVSPPLDGIIGLSYLNQIGRAHV